MTNRRREQQRRDRHETGADRWEELGSPDDDDFWGDLPDWSNTASTSHRSGRASIGGRTDEVIDPTPIGGPRPDAGAGTGGGLRGAWNQLLGGGADTTREHRRIDVAPTGPAPIDELAPWLDEVDDDTWVTAADAATEPAEVSPIRGIERRWMDEAAAADDRRVVPIDPLLARLGVTLIVLALLVPLAISLASSGGSLDEASVELAGSQTIEEPAITIATPTATAPPTTVLDPASLPPAVPVNPDPGEPTAPAATVGSATLTAADDTAASATESTTTPAVAVGDTQNASDASLEGVEEPADADDPADRVEPADCAIDYTVVAGDFWIRLADASNVSLSDLLAVNRATAQTPLFPGLEICLPAGATVPAPPTTVAPATTAAPTTAAPTTAAPTTAAPTTAAPTTAPPAEPPGPEEIKQIIRDVFPDELEAKALDIAYRESRFVPTAKNFCCYGLFQIYWEVHDVWLVDLGITSASQLYDPETNARAAYALYQRAGGWGPWSTA